MPTRRRPTGVGHPRAVPNPGDTDYPAFDKARQTGGLEGNKPPSTAQDTAWDQHIRQTNGQMAADSFRAASPDKGELGTPWTKMFGGK